MVYYHTSRNIKMIRNIIMDYGASSEVSPCEYMKSYIDKCPEDAEDSKISWIVETFLGIQKHGQFLKEITSHMSEELSEEDQDYFMIIFYAVTFQITPTDMSVLYKCLFNLSKPLLNTFTKFLSNNEVLSFITQIAQSEYDTNFVTEKIIGPIFAWQPYISEMGHSYAEYVKKIESRRVRLPTIPVQPNVLNRKGKDLTALSMQMSIPGTPPNSLYTKGKKMLTKSTIDNKLKLIHDKNRQKALQLLDSVKNQDYHFAQEKSAKYFKQVNNTKYEIENEFKKPTMKTKMSFYKNSVPPAVKETTATIKRINKRVQQCEQEELQWLQDLVVNCRNTDKVTELLEFDRQEKERERLLDIEKKHLMGQISYEEAVIAKKKLFDENKRKYEDFLKEKQGWEEEIEIWKRIEMEKNRKHVEKLSLMELDMLHAKKNAILRKKQTADKLRKESEDMLAMALKNRQDELERRIKMIKEIKILTMIAKKAKVPKIIDLTESSGLGLLCEMSIAELQERLSLMKLGLNENLVEKKKQIKEAHLTAKNELEETKKSIKSYMTDQAKTRKLKLNSKFNTEIGTSTEISELKKILENKRKLRKQLTS